MLYEEKDDHVLNLSKIDKTMTNGIEADSTNNETYESLSMTNHSYTPQTKPFGVVISNVTAKWTNSQTENTLENINLNVKPGRLVAIIGPVGAGKV